MILIILTAFAVCSLWLFGWIMFADFVRSVQNFHTLRGIFQGILAIFLFGLGLYLIVTI